MPQNRSLTASPPESPPVRWISAIIPAWQEAPLIADAVRNAAGFADEVIVADGGSPDGTVEAARAAGARVVRGAKGRGLQLQSGAEAARGDVLLFLHADARLPPSARQAVWEALSDPDVIGGAFYIRFLPTSWFTRLIEPANHLRRLVVRRTYGDCAMFVRADALRRIGGVRPWPVMHDYELSGRMRRAGRFAYLREPCVYASDRRFRGRELRTLGLWIAIRTLYRVGVSPHRLGRAYADARGRAEAFLAASAAWTAEDAAATREGRDGGEARTRHPAP